jgi:hypothetical protein
MKNLFNTIKIFALLIVSIAPFAVLAHNLIFLDLEWWGILLNLIVVAAYVAVLALVTIRYAKPTPFETNLEILSLHPLYDSEVKAVKAYKFNGYLVLIVESRNGDDSVRTFHPSALNVEDNLFITDSIERYPTLRKDNPLYDKAKRLIEEREDAE